MNETVVHQPGEGPSPARRRAGTFLGRLSQALREHLGIERVFNYYGMVEQGGSIFMECEHGHLHAPVFADVIVRDPITLAPLGPGQTGVLQVLSALPVSYPGHSLLTEDLGSLDGAGFRLAGRAPEADLRGCSLLAEELGSAG